MTTAFDATSDDGYYTDGVMNSGTVEAKGMATRINYKRKFHNQALIGPQVREIRKYLFLGDTPSEIVKKVPKATTELVKSQLEFMNANSVGPDTQGPYTLGQAGIICCLTSRRMRDICDKQEIGFRVGLLNMRMIEKSDVIEQLKVGRHHAGRPPSETKTTKTKSTKR